MALFHKAWIGRFRRVLPWRLQPSSRSEGEKKTDVIEHPEVFGHVGLLVNGPSGTAGLPFV
jgi:hypothetical protein